MSRRWRWVGSTTNGRRTVQQPIREPMINQMVRFDVLRYQHGYHTVRVLIDQGCLDKMFGPVYMRLADALAAAEDAYFEVLGRVARKVQSRPLNVRLRRKIAKPSTTAILEELRDRIASLEPKVDMFLPERRGPYRHGYTSCRYAALELVREALRKLEGAKGAEGPSQKIAQERTIS
jgi:hypothetical protein